MKRAYKLAWVSVVLSMIGILPASAQQFAPTGDPTPAPELEQLSFLVGDWACTGQMETSPTGLAHATVGRVTVSRELGGFWYVGRYTETKTTVNAYPLSFQFIQGFDPETRTFTMSCFQSDGAQCHQTSPGMVDGKVVYSGQLKGVPVRTTLTPKGLSALEHLGEVQVNGKWYMIDHETCSRIVSK